MAITSFTGVKTTIATTGQYNRLITGQVDTISVGMGITRSTTWTYGSSGADTVNQAVTLLFTATNNTTTTLTLAALTNVLGETTATLTKVKWLFIELLSTAQDSTNGTACSSVTISPSLTNPIITSPLGAAKTYTMENGDKWVCEKHNTGGITVTASSADSFDVLNNDAVVSGGMRVTLLGNA